MLDRIALRLLPAFAFVACSGQIMDRAGPPTRDAVVPPPPGLDGVGYSGAHRLTRSEYDATLRELLGEPGQVSSALPQDVGGVFDGMADVDVVFDNEFGRQHSSTALIES